MPRSASLRIVVFREGALWLAQMLEHDIGAQADDLRDLVRRVSLQLEIEGDALGRLPPAPPYFDALWSHAAGWFIPTDAVAFGDFAMEWRLVA